MARALDKGVLAANILLLDAMQEAADLLEECGIPAMIIKGGVFAPFLYPQIDLRPMEDIDIVVGHGRLEEARTLLRASGYREVPGSPAELLRGRIKLDIEDGLWYLSAAEEREFWKRALILEDTQTRIRAPSWEDHLIVLIAHNAVHHICWDVTHAEDLRRLLRRPLNWDAVAQRLAAWRLAPAAAATFAFLGLDAPPGLPRPADLSWAGRMEAAWLGRLLRRSPLSAAGFLLRLWTSPRRREAFWSWLFPPREFIRLRYNTENPEAFSVLRPLLLAVKALRSAREDDINNDPGWRNGERRRAKSAAPRPPAANQSD